MSSIYTCSMGFVRTRSPSIDDPRLSKETDDALHAAVGHRCPVWGSYLAGLPLRRRTVSQCSVGVCCQKSAGAQRDLGVLRAARVGAAPQPARNDLRALHAVCVRSDRAFDSRRCSTRIVMLWSRSYTSAIEVFSPPTGEPVSALTMCCAGTICRRQTSTLK